MSDNYIRLCPTDVSWQPEREAAEAAAAYVAGLFSGPAGDVEEVKCEFYEQATLIGAGENTERVICPHCGAGALTGWFWDLIEGNGGSIGNPQVKCRAAASRSPSAHSATTGRSGSPGSRSAR